MPSPEYTKNNHYPLVIHWLSNYPLLIHCLSNNPLLFQKIEFSICTFLKGTNSSMCKAAEDSTDRLKMTPADSKWWRQTQMAARVLTRCQGPLQLTAEDSSPPQPFEESNLFLFEKWKWKLNLLYLFISGRYYICPEQQKLCRRDTMLQARILYLR